MQKIKLPGIGMRIIKSAIAIALCYAVFLIRGERGIVFYSQLAALWCIQMYKSNTLKNAVQRTIGTCVGAVYGLLYLLIYPAFMKTSIPLEIWEMIVVSLMIILVLYTTVLLKKNQASYFSCVVFLSIVVNHISDVNPYIFVWNRFLDTMIGIGIGVLVNDINLSFHKDKKTLFVSGIDDILVDTNDKMSAYSRVELNRMIDSGMKFTVSTKRTPASLMEPMREVHLKFPVIAMDGAVLFDISKNAYLKIYVISSDTAKGLMELIIREKMNWYANVVIDDMLVIYYGDTTDQINISMVEKLRTSPFRNYVKRPLPENEDVVYFMLLDKTEVIENFYGILKAEQYEKELRIVTYPSNDYKGYSYIKIYNKNATKENMLEYLKQTTNSEKIITFGTIEGQYDVMIHNNNFNEMVRRVNKMYEPIFYHKDSSKEKK